MIEPLVSSEWLYENLNLQDLIVLDASQKGNKSGVQTKFESLRIKGARFFDLKVVFSDSEGKFSTAFPSPEQFEKGCRNIGINSTSQIIIYDNLGIYASPRVWWMFKAMGHENVHILNGGLPDWIHKGYETEAINNKAYECGNFHAVFNSEVVKTFDFVTANVQSKEQLLVDARSEGRFNGTEDEPRKGLRNGSIPNSINIPYTSVLEGGKFKSKEELKLLFNDRIPVDVPLIFSCGSGITACIVLLAAELVLDNRKSVYDGSWTEWASLFQSK